MKSLLPARYHYNIYIFALIVLVIGLPISKFMMSVSQIILAANWLLEGNLKDKFNRFFKNKPALLLSSLLFLHFIGLLYTSDFTYAFNDIRIKAPLFVLPLILSTSQPLPKKIFNVVLQFFIASVIFGTIVSTLILTDVIHRNIVDVRKISIFISHIRFALLIDIAIFIAVYFIYYERKLSVQLLWAGIITWLLVFLVLMESITGLCVLAVVFFVLMFYLLATSQNKWLKWGGVLAGLLLLFYLVNTTGSVIKSFSKKDALDTSGLDVYTAQGNPYQHDFTGKQTENGHYIWMYFSTTELENSWNKRSKMKFDGKDLKGNELRFTLMRYLTSKGLRKDSLAMSSLTEDEIKAVERGVVNVNYPDLSSLKGRLYELCWEWELYKTTGDPNGHSLTQRFEYWKTALDIVKENFLFGVGTGDVQTAFDQQYVKMNSPLQKEWRLRSHNQYLSIAIAFGITGLTWFLLTLVYPVLKQKMLFDYLYITFFIVAAISFLTEDTLETQAGVTFYAFLNAFFLFAREERSDHRVVSSSGVENVSEQN